MMEFNEQPDGRYLPGYGGDTSNTAIAAARQGASVGFVTRLGADTFGDSFMALWASEGVDASTVQRDPDGYTSVYFVTHSDCGHQFSYFRDASAASRMRSDDLPEDYIAGARLLHVTGISQGISNHATDAVFRAIEIANDNSVQVSYDPNVRTKLWSLDRARAIIHAAMRRCQIALPSSEDAVCLTGLTNPDHIVDYYLNLGADMVVLKLGAEGSLVATQDERRHVEGRDITPVDATAAGDTFDGALLAELAAGRDVFSAAYYANAAAALSTQGYGAVAPIPHRASVEAFLTTSKVPH